MVLRPATLARAVLSSQVTCEIVPIGTLLETV